MSCLSKKRRIFYHLMMRKSHIFSSYFFPGLFLILCFRYLKVYLIHHYWKKPFNFYPFLIFGLTFSLFLCLSWPTRIYIHTAFHVFKCTILVFRVEILAGKIFKNMQVHMLRWAPFPSIEKFEEKKGMGSSMIKGPRMQNTVFDLMEIV